MYVTILKKVSAFLPEKFKETQLFWYYDAEAHRKKFLGDNTDKIRNDLSEFFRSKLPKVTETEQLTKENEKLTKENEQLKKKVKELQEQLEVIIL